MYLVTGDARYYDAVLGSWELCRAHWQQAGGSISIIEFERDPPNSNYLRQNLGELCGSGFGYFSASASNIHSREALRGRGPDWRKDTVLG
jgi:hypothetical protein